MGGLPASAVSAMDVVEVKIGRDTSAALIGALVGKSGGAGV